MMITCWNPLLVSHTSNPDQNCIVSGPQLERHAYPVSWSFKYLRNVPLLLSLKSSFSYHWSYFKSKSLYRWPSRRNHKLIWNRESTCQTRKIFFQHWTSPSIFCSSTRFSTKENYFNYYSNRKWYELLQETSFSLSPPYMIRYIVCRKHPKI